MFRVACALAASLALLTWPAFAQDDAAQTTDAAQQAEEPADEEDEEVDYHRRGVYLGLAGTWAVEKFGDANDLNIEDGGGFNARAGYRALSWLSGEVQGEFVPRFDIDFGSDSGDLAMWLVGANLRLNLPTDLIQPYITLGGGYMGADLTGASAGDRNYDGNGGYGRFGGGVEFWFWPFLALDLGISYVLPAGDVDDLNFLSINFGGIYRF